ncbi:Protein lin-37-like protein [Frankliniella fusca]|uniref:Protein lin-37-like protein n=1 Tax=Frankliniella fusca TaxID=407009 RepID=A0AAE1I396_9NEOP|nr:Protein lin-37-like protein [Frankliniella fusca]
MVKRRRGNGGQSVRQSTETEKERSTAINDDVSLARDRLRGALHLLLDPSESCGNDELHKYPHKRKQDEYMSQLKQEQLLARQEEKRAATAARRKQRRAEMSQKAYHNTFVMKLFDRSVDLAQFKDGTPLYPICRAWMANQPRNLQMKEIKRSQSPETKPKQEPIDDDERIANGSGEGMDVDTVEADADLVKDTYQLPPPAPLNFLRYPILKPDAASNLDLIINGSESLSREELLQEHVTKWTGVRSEWIKAANENEDRFKQSKRILRAIYEKAQKAFE